MECRHCKEEMMEGVTVCPACGGDNSQNNQKKRTVLIAVICCVALVIGVIGMALALGGFSVDVDRVTNKPNYTEADDVVKSKVDLVVATAGDAKLTNGELQVLYWSMVYDFVTYTGEYATYFIDFTKPLSEQLYDVETNMTWEHFFLESALATWLRYEVLTTEAKKAGVTMDAASQEFLDQMYSLMEADLEDLEFESVDELIRNDFGNAATFEDYYSYMEIYHHGNHYFSLLQEELEITDAMIQDYYTAHESTMISKGYGKEHGSKVQVRHLLVEPADKTPEALDAAKQKAQDIMDQWVANGAKEEEFAELAKEHSTCGSAVNGGLLDPFTKGQMVKEFEDWCFTKGRQYGEYDLVQTEYGWHIIFFINKTDIWYEVSRNSLVNEMMSDVVTDLEKNYPMTVDFENISLADALKAK